MRTCGRRGGDSTRAAAGKQPRDSLGKNDPDTFSLAHQHALSSISLVDPIPYLFRSLDSSATSLNTGGELTPADLASRHRCCSESNASRLSRPWSWMENRIKCRRKLSSLVGSNDKLAAQAKEWYFSNSLRTAWRLSSALPG